MSGHADTALDQLRLADDLTETPEQAHANALAAAIVHAVLAVAEAVREENALAAEWLPAQISTDMSWRRVTGT